MQCKVFDAETGKSLKVQLKNPNTTTYGKAGMYSPHVVVQKRYKKDPITQKVGRKMGDNTGWKHKNEIREKNAQEAFRASFHGVQHRLRFEKMDAKERQSVSYQELDMMKERYFQQHVQLISLEKEREIQRQTAFQLETSSIGRKRLLKQQHIEREFYASQIKRIKQESELKLAHSMLQLNLLR